MRLSFPAGEHYDTLIAAGDTSIGAAADNTIVLNRSGVAAHHARLSVSDSGIVLNVLDAQARTHVNTRPVREKAILRLGDIVSLDTLQFVLKPDRDDDIRIDIPTAQSRTSPASGSVSAGSNRINPTGVLLRGLSGTQFGKIVSVRGKVVVGSGAGADLVLEEQEMTPRHACIEATTDEIYLRDLGSSDGSVVNGVKVRNAVLHAGDQIAFGRSRFLVEAPGLQSRRERSSSSIETAPNITQTMKAIQIPDSSAAANNAATGKDPGSKNDIWWLIGAAALIAAGLALLFLVKF